MSNKGLKGKDKKDAKEIQKLEWEENMTKYNISVNLIIKIWRRYNERDTGETFDEDSDPLLPHIDDTKVIPRNKKFRKLVGRSFIELIEKNQLNVSNMDLNNPDRKILQDEDYEFDNEEDQQKLNNVKTFLLRFRGKFLNTS